MTRLAFFLSFSSCFLAREISAQTTPVPSSLPENQKVTADWRLEGQVGVSTNGQAFFLNFGGPNIRLQHKKVAGGVCMYPSLRFWDDAPRAFVTPALGFGAFIQYKKVSLIAPVYYNSPKNSWVFSYGVAYKLSK